MSELRGLGGGVLTGLSNETLYHNHAQMTRHCVCAACESHRAAMSNRELGRLRRIEAAAREVCEAIYEDDAHARVCDTNGTPSFPCDCKVPAVIEALRAALDLK